MATHSSKLQQAANQCATQAANAVAATTPGAATVAARLATLAYRQAVAAHTLVAKYAATQPHTNVAATGYLAGGIGAAGTVLRIALANQQAAWYAAAVQCQPQVQLARQQAGTLAASVARATANLRAALPGTGNVYNTGQHRAALVATCHTAAALLRPAISLAGAPALLAKAHKALASTQYGTYGGTSHRQLVATCNTTAIWLRSVCAGGK